MKRAIFAAAAVVFSIASTLLAGTVAFAEPGNIVAQRSSEVLIPERMNLRGGPSTSARILRGLPRGATAAVLESAGDWSKIKVFGQTGWVHINTGGVKAKVVVAKEKGEPFGSATAAGATKIIPLPTLPVAPDLITKNISAVPADTGEKPLGHPSQSKAPTAPAVAMVSTVTTIPTTSMVPAIPMVSSATAAKATQPAPQAIEQSASSTASDRIGAWVPQAAEQPLELLQILLAAIFLAAMTYLGVSTWLGRAPRSHGFLDYGLDAV